VTRRLFISSGTHDWNAAVLRIEELERQEACALRRFGTSMSISTRVAGLKEMLLFDNRWQLIVDRFLFRCSVAVYRYRGCKILLDHDGGDASGVRACLASDMYRQFIPLMKLKGPLTLLDCGANTGGFPLLFSTEGLNLSKVVCVEMNPYAHSRLQYNLFTNLAAELHCLNLIVEDSARTHSIRLGIGSVDDSLMKENMTGRSFDIRSISINDLLLRYFGEKPVDIVKIDIEGAEHILFSGNNYDLLSRCRYIVIELHAVQSEKSCDVTGKIEKLGFELVEKDADVFLFSNRQFN
jgi:FkbM family methyltransferase